MKNWEKGFTGIVLLSFLLLIAFYFLGNNNIPKDSNYNIVIYGNTVYPNGELSNRLKARLDQGLYLYEVRNIDKVIVSGGIGKEGIDEAKYMKEYLFTQGISNSDILIDSLGNTTQDTSINAMKLLFNDNIQIIGVSQWFHIPRVKLSLRQSGFENVYGSYPFYFEWRDLYSFGRELIAYFKYLMFNS